MAGHVLLTRKDGKKTTVAFVSAQKAVPCVLIQAKYHKDVNSHNVGMENVNQFVLMI